MPTGFETPSANPPRPDQANGDRTKIHVLQVEDNLLDAELVLCELKLGGFDASSTVVQTPADFKREISIRQPDVVLADYNLPQWRGMDALEVMRAKGLDIPLILVSGALGDEAAVACIKQG